jgi:hypothetical protein
LYLAQSATLNWKRTPWHWLVSALFSSLKIKTNKIKFMLLEARNMNDLPCDETNPTAKMINNIRIFIVNYQTEHRTATLHLRTPVAWQPDLLVGLR